MLTIKNFLRFIGIFQIIFLILLTIDVNVNHDAVGQAIMGMVWGLVILWVAIGGSLIRRWRDPIRHYVQKLNFNWRFKFVTLATICALIEEAITVTMTNLAPLFGVNVGEAYITASANYLDVVLFHSVIVFIPMFFAWTLLLQRYTFKPLQVFVLFGFTGMLGEIISFGGTGILNMGLWVYVYGLMIFLSAYSIPKNLATKPVRFYHYPLAIIFPLLMAIPVAIVIIIIHPIGIHFDPL